MKFAISPTRSANRWMLAAAVAGAGLLAPLPATPIVLSRASAADEEAVPQAVRESVDKALAWLARDQKPDGTFPQGDTSTTAIPSLCVLAFLARGHAPGQGPYGQTLYRSIDYVINIQQEDGLLAKDRTGTAPMDEHGIATFMLAECYHEVDAGHRAKINKALDKSCKLILAAQRPNNEPKLMPYTGGWRYQPSSADADIIVTGWQMLALRSAVKCGIKIPRENLEAAREFIKRCAYKDGGFSYRPGDPSNQTRTGTGILMLELFRDLDPKLALGEHPKEALAGGDYLLNFPPTNPEMEFYYEQVYVCSRAISELGGKYTQVLYPKLSQALLGQQNDDGTFGGGGGPELRAGTAYRTAMAVLAPRRAMLHQ